MNMIDKLIEKIKQTNNPTVIGLDPRYEMLPKCVTDKYPKTLEGVGQAIVEYMKAFEETCKYAKEKGMIVIADIKRGDIGSTAARIFKCIFRKNSNWR